MGFTVDLYTFAKKVNSTVRPTTAAASYSCVMKEPCGILNPSIGLSIGLTANPYRYNYAFIPAFDRYYFVKEWTFQNALWYAQLEVDVLASWKDTIGASVCYVLRSASESSPEIVDTTYPGTIDTTLMEQTTASPWITSDIADGMFVVGVAGQSTTYYIFTKAGLDYFFTYLFSDTYAAALLTDEWFSLYPELKVQTNPLQYITSIMWIPFLVTGTAVETIRVGWVDVPVGAWRVDGSGIHAHQTDFVLYRHPQQARGTYLNAAPYSNYSLFYPPWGNIPLDPDVVANSESISAYWAVDLRTGIGTLAIFGGTQHLMSLTHAQVCLNYQVSQIVNREYGSLSTLMPVAAAAGNIIAGNYTAAGAGIEAQIGNAVAAKIPSATTIGSAGGLNSLNGTPALQYEFKRVVDIDSMNHGYPLCKCKVINELSGYVKVSNAYIEMIATQDERKAVTDYMEGGFFYE